MLPESENTSETNASQLQGQRDPQVEMQHTRASTLGHVIDRDVEE